MEEHGKCASTADILHSWDAMKLEGRVKYYPACGPGFELDDEGSASCRVCDVPHKSAYSLLEESGRFQIFEFWRVMSACIACNFENNAHQIWIAWHRGDMGARELRFCMHVALFNVKTVRASPKLCCRERLITKTMPLWRGLPPQIPTYIFLHGLCDLF